MLGALNGGHIDVLITDMESAQMVLQEHDPARSAGENNE
jgi:DNA-binding transcriptional regulator LsrR (DeoR family)